jgi:hypothetical protein
MRIYLLVKTLRLKWAKREGRGCASRPLRCPLAVSTGHSAYLGGSSPRGGSLLRGSSVPWSLRPPKNLSKSLSVASYTSLLPSSCALSVCVYLSCFVGGTSFVSGGASDVTPPAWYTMVVPSVISGEVGRSGAKFSLIKSAAVLVDSSAPAWS